MGKGNFSDDSKRDAVAPITEHGYPVPLSVKSDREYSEWVERMGDTVWKTLQWWSGPHTPQT